MSQSTHAALPILGLVGLAIPFTYVLSALSTSNTTERRASLAAAAGLVLAIALTLGWLLLTGGQAHVVHPSILGLPLPSVRLDVVTGTLLVLVTFIATVIARFARNYLAGDERRTHFVRWLMATLAAVTLLITSDHLVIIAAAWVGTSLALHQLLTVYRERTQALVAAHKKFLVSRVAELCLAAAITLVGIEVQSFSLNALYAWSAAHPDLPWTMQVAAVFFVLGAALKCAQLPFHGWLTQVMEAPTPVSALLHAGVINLGGVLMIRLSPLMSSASFAQTLLVVIGCATATIASLVMITRVSIKVALAWSTIAQMGFMLVQCGLGAYHLALLHIVAHSLYKAHAFLSSGSTVDGYRVRELARQPDPVRLKSWLSAGALSLLVVSTAAWVLGFNPVGEPAVGALLVVTALAPTPLLVRGAQAGLSGLASMVLGSAALTGLGLTGHWIASTLFRAPVLNEHAWIGAIVVVLSFVALFAVQGILHSMPHGRLGKALYPRLFAGLYLDERFTRLTFRIWPPILPPRVERPETAHIADVVEA